MMGEQSGWQLSGRGPEAYERYIAQPFLTPCAPDLIEAAAVTAGDRVLDIACGTGAVARSAARRVGATGQVVGMDLNTGMLDFARLRVQQDPEAAIEWRPSDVAALDAPDTSFDVVLCQQGMQFFPDKAAALREMFRVLVPGGRVAFSVLRAIHYNPYQQAVADALARHVGPNVATVIHTPFALDDATTLRHLTTTAGFRDVHIQIAIKVCRHPSLQELVPGYLAATPAADTVAALDDSVQAAIVQDVQAALQAYMDDDGLAVPLDFHVVTAQK